MQRPAPSPLPYHPEIDGLRAVAVLAVVLYHFGLPILDGGFVGVDIFFVISGYLIGGILWREYWDRGTLNLWRFYIRRFRRLAPAFFVMALVTTLVGWALMLPFEFREYGKTLIASVVYLSNVYFYRGAGYFDSASDQKPLLHTWSLSVEEQFYVFLPLVILLLARHGALLLPVLTAVCAASFAASALFSDTMPVAAFYLFPFRAWELLSGVVLAIWMQRRERPALRSVPMSWLGLLFVFAAVVAIQPGPGFPGVQALLPVAGTLLILANLSAPSAVNRWLRHPVPVFFGLISYSLYLWHWPVLVLSLYLRGQYANPVEPAVWMALSVGLAYLSWRYIEQPVRQASRLSGVSVLGTAALASSVLLALGSLVYLRDGLPGRFRPEARVQITAAGDFLQDWSRCRVADKGPLSGLEVCPIGPEGAPQVLVWGDSHVRAFKEGLDQAAWQAGTPGLILWHAGCPPVFDLRKVENAATLAQDTACTQANLQIKQAFGRMDELRRVLLIARWSYYATGRGVGLDAANRIALYPTTGPLNLDLTQSELLARALRNTVAHLHQHFDEVDVLRQVPEIPGYDSRLAAREAAHTGWPLAAPVVTVPTVARAEVESRVAVAEAPFRALADEGKIRWIDTWGPLCSDDLCSAVHGGSGFYFDNNHLTNAGSRALSDLFRPVFGPRGDT
ncbi:acyltransferase family protein [Puniceibacterium confluentis]|uniref:acyltransferase family protein n=1 Tax=Puniceibacterium confluentis TaxID=1958944 RepID=UPI0035631CE8